MSKHYDTLNTGRHNAHIAPAVILLGGMIVGGAIFAGSEKKHIETHAGTASLLPATEHQSTPSEQTKANYYPLTASSAGSLIQHAIDLKYQTRQTQTPTGMEFELTSTKKPARPEATDITVGYSDGTLSFAATAKQATTTDELRYTWKLARPEDRADFTTRSRSGQLSLTHDVLPLLQTEVDVDRSSLSTETTLVQPIKGSDTAAGTLAVDRELQLSFASDSIHFTTVSTAAGDPNLMQQLAPPLAAINSELFENIT